MATKILIRRDTAANWTANDPVLFQGEIGYDLTNKKLKIGDGSTSWNSLEYYQGDDATEVAYSNSTSGLSASTVQAAIDEIEGRVDINESDITSVEGRLDTIEGNSSTEGSIAKAEADAKDYTDAREIAITTAYESYADQAEADAKIYADNQIDAAKLALGTNFVVADTTEADALTDIGIGDIVFVADNGDGKWAQYKVSQVDPTVFTKIMDQDVMLNAISASSIKSAYESNADTNALTNARLSSLNRVDSHVDDSSIHFTLSEISITESQISDLGNYEPADGSILKSEDIGLTVQGYNEDIVIDGDYERFDSSDTYPLLRAQGTTAEDVGLGSVTNESKATMFANPDFTGVPTAPTADPLTSTTQIATTEFVQLALETIDGGEFN